MDLSNSINFLLENAGPVIQYRLRKEILKNISKTEEENLLEQIYQTPHFKLVESYVKPNGYIGSGMHGGASWRGVRFQETPLQDAENAVSLLVRYGIPKTHPMIVNFVAAIRDEEVLREEFSNYPMAKERFERRYDCMNSGNSLMGLMYFTQGRLGYGDDYEDLKAFQENCLQCFARVLEINSFDEITRESSARKNTGTHRIIDPDEYFPGWHNLGFLADTTTWRTPRNVRVMANVINHLSEGIGDSISFLIKSYKTPVGPLAAITRMIEPFSADYTAGWHWRRGYIDIARLGVGESVGIIAQSAANVSEALGSDGILRLNYEPKFNKYYTIEAGHRKSKYSKQCELTFWAVQFLHYTDFFV